MIVTTLLCVRKRIVKHLTRLLAVHWTITSRLHHCWVNARQPQTCRSLTRCYVVAAQCNAHSLFNRHAPWLPQPLQQATLLQMCTCTLVKMWQLWCTSINTQRIIRFSVKTPCLLWTGAFTRSPRDEKASSVLNIRKRGVVTGRIRRSMKWRGISSLMRRIKMVVGRGNNRQISR